MLYPLSGGLWGTFNYTPWMRGDNIYIFDYLGELVEEFSHPTRELHHDIVEKTPGGNLIVPSSATDESIQDAILEFDRKTKKVVKEWDLRKVLDEKRPVRVDHTIDDFGKDWLHVNSVRYSKEDKSLIISGRNQCTVFKIDYNSSELKWISGNHVNFTEKYQPYLLNPVNFNTTLDPDQDWHYFQHAVSQLPNGNYIMFDDGGSRPGFEKFNGEAEKQIKEILGIDYWEHLYHNKSILPGYSRLVEYKINETAMTIEKVYEYTDFPFMPNTIIGSVAPIEDDIFLIGYGEIGAVTVLNKRTNQPLWQAFLDQPYYRAAKIDFYERYQ